MSITLFAKDIKSMSGNGFEKPLCFVENKGQIRSDNQIREDIQFQLYGKGVDVYVGKQGLQYQFKSKRGDKRSTYLVAVRLLGANPNCEVVTDEKNSYYENYFLSNINADGFTANAFNKVIYKDVYPNIDWVLYVKDGSVEYDFNVKEGGDINNIRIQYEGATQLSLNASGALVAKTPMGIITERQPYSYETATGRKVKSKFTLNNHILGFEAAAYKGGVTIDPYLNWATYYGGGNEDVITCVRTSSGGDIYACGYTNSSDLTTTTGAYVRSAPGGSRDAFLIKYNSSGSLAFATYYGGGNTDHATSLALDNAGSNVFMVGYTNSSFLGSSFGVHKPFYTGSGFDMFMVKFNNTGTTRAFATYIGGGNNDQATSVGCDNSGNVYVGGFTASTGISTDGTSLGGSQDGYLGRFSQSTSTRSWSTYIGGSNTDEVDAITVDASGSIAITGQTASAGGIATTGAAQALLGTTGSGTDAFVSAYSSTGSRYWGTYLGGSGVEQGLGIATDAAGNVYVCGNTTSTDSIAAGYATTASYVGGTQDGFLVKYSASGTLNWGTYIGGNSDDFANGITTDIFGNIVVVGYSNSTTSLSTPGAYQTNNAGNADAFVAKYSSIGQRYYTTYFGSTLNDLGNSITTDPTNSGVIIAGSSRSNTGITTSGAAQASYGGGTTLGDGFVAMFIQDTLISIREPLLDTLICTGGTFTIRDTTINLFQSGNTFTVQLSDASGSFASPTTIGSATATGAGSITCTIPSSTTPGTGYRIRIVASNPSVISPINRWNIHIVSTLPAQIVSGTPLVCVGQTIRLFDTAFYVVNSYNWSGPASFNSTLQNPVITGAVAANTGVYTITTTHTGCPDVTNTFSVTVNTYIPPAPFDSVNSPICQGSTLRLYARPSVAGTFTFNWTGPSGFSTTTQNPVIFSATPSNSGMYYVYNVLNGCASPSSSIYVNVLPLDTPNVTISAAPDTIICPGTLVHFTARTTDAGFSPTYQWYTASGTPVVGAVYSTYSTSTFPVGYRIFCVMNNNIACPDKPSDTSNVLPIVTVNNTPVVSITVSPDSVVSLGSSVTFTGIIGGRSITAFQWYVNNRPVFDTTTTLTLTNIRSNDTVRLEAISSAFCANIAVSNTIIIRPTLGVASVSPAFQGITLLPNPNNGTFNVLGKLTDISEGTVEMTITNTIGQVIYTGQADIDNGELKHTVNINDYSSGMYILQLRKNGEGTNIRFVKE